MDAWDALQKNEFLSLEGFVFAFSQMFQVFKTGPFGYMPVIAIAPSITHVILLRLQNTQIPVDDPRLMKYVHLHIREFTF